MRPSTLMVQQAYALLAKRLTGAGVASPESDAWRLIEAATGESRGRLLMEPRALKPSEFRTLGGWLARRELREPLQRILGRTNFYGLELLLEPGVLIPRPETERLVELALRSLGDEPSPRLLDVGTGSGAIALALKSERPEATVMATDVSSAALRVCADNARRLRLDVETVESDLLGAEPVRRFAAEAHAVLANPPYLPRADLPHAQPEVRWDPEDALYAGDDGLAIFRRLAAQALVACSLDAMLLVELDPRNVERAAAESTSWSKRVVHEDLTGRRRFLELRR